MKIVTWRISELAEMFKERQKQKYDVILVLSGPRGSGKSTFIWKLFKKLGKFNPKTDLVYSREEVAKQLEEKRHGLIWADEMVTAAHNRDFWSGEQKELIKMLNMYRDHHNVLAGCIPFFYDLDTQVRKFVFCRIELIRRGVGIVMMNNSDSLYSNDPWSTDRNKKMEMSWNAKWKKNKRLTPQFSKLSTYSGYIRFGKMRATDEEKYQKIKDDKRTIIREKYDNENNNQKENPDSIILERIKKGFVTKKVLMEHCYLNKLNFNSTYARLNARLKNEGNYEQLSLLLKNNETSGPRITFNSSKPKRIKLAKPI